MRRGFPERQRPITGLGILAHSVAAQVPALGRRFPGLCCLGAGPGLGLLASFPGPVHRPAGDLPTSAFLGRLNAVGPAEYQTPYQYMYRLQDELPGHREQLSVIIGSYVRALYGRKETSAEEDAQLVRAWLELRMPLLFHLLRRRNRENEEV